MRITSAVIVSLAALVGAASSARGQGVGGASPTETTHSLYGRFQLPEDPLQFETNVGLPSDRIGVELDSAGPFWLKHMQAASPPLILSGDHVFVFEHLVIAGDQSWSGWTQVADPDFDWVLNGIFGPVTSIRANGAIPAGLSIETDGPILRFSFDPLLPGTEIDLTSELRYAGASGLQSFDLRQSPTPEPATLALTGIAVLIILGRPRVGHLRSSVP